MRRLVIALLFLAVPIPASALTPKENALMGFSGKSLVAVFQKDYAAARSHCEAGRATLTASEADGFMTAYVEACLAIVATAEDDRAKACAARTKALTAWNTGPLPADEFAGTRKHYRDVAIANRDSTCAPK